MTRVAEQELQQSIKKSELRSMIATVASTVTVLCGMFFGGLKIVEAVKYTVKVEVMAEINDRLNQSDKLQLIKDNQQDAEIKDLKNAVNNMSIKIK